MTYAFTQDVPIDAVTYERIVRGLGETPPAGLIVHIATERPEGGLRYTDVWESESAFERFAEQRLHPVVHGILAEVFGDDFPSEPERVAIPALHVWTGR
ncbi:MAG: hypothetical protein ACXIVQ_11075 [Acidimicrobiales bacterium]